MNVLLFNIDTFYIINPYKLILRKTFLRIATHFRRFLRLPRNLLNNYERSLSSKEEDMTKIEK
ncbi:Uncharacterized protein CTYZ_00003989 [Cryptosporidium tyzzeri]|nr:Uncharacterized protein CTYZ_00003989 [Cryptosporidium tyzzeri]